MWDLTFLYIQQLSVTAQAPLIPPSPSASAGCVLPQLTLAGLSEMSH